MTTTEIRAEDGSVQIRTEIRNEKTGMNIVVNVSKNAKGKITSATAEILDRGFGNVKISGEALSEIVKAAGTKKGKGHDKDAHEKRLGHPGSDGQCKYASEKNRET